MGYENVGRVWSPETLEHYLSRLKKPDWCEAITFHHTEDPSLASRPEGLRIRNIENIRDWYIDYKGWSTGPHFFIDEDQIFGMCDPRKKGTHALSFNSFALGIEVLGNYDCEEPQRGRGLACWQNAAATGRVLLQWLNLDADEETVLFHRDDEATSKTCPGTKVEKDWLLDIMKAKIVPPVQPTAKPDVGIPWASWEFCGERWCVPVFNFLTAKGISPETIIASLKSKGGKFFYGGELIEGAFYVGPDSPLKPNQSTWAPAQELLDLIKDSICR